MDEVEYIKKKLEENESLKKEFSSYMQNISKKNDISNSEIAKGIKILEGMERKSKKLRKELEIAELRKLAK